MHRVFDRANDGRIFNTGLNIIQHLAQRHAVNGHGLLMDKPGFVQLRHNGGIPAIRNHYTLEECLHESYIDGMGLDNTLIPDDPELPMILNKVHPIQDVVKVDYMLPGCPPTADIIWDALTALIEGREPSFTLKEIRYD